MEVGYLAAFYKEITDEIRRLREEQWKLSYYFIAEGMGIIYLFSDGKISKYINLYTLLFVLVLQGGCVVMYFYHLHKNHTYIGRARNVRRRLEKLFGLQELKLLDGEAVLPEAWKDSVSKWFEYDTVVMPLGLFVISVQGASIYIVVVGLSAFVLC
jgi:hypothetical protein